MTVQEKDGPQLFTQVVATPNLTVECTQTGGKNGDVLRKLVLKDGTGKQLYAMTFPQVAQYATFDFQPEFFQSESEGKTGGVSFVITPLAQKPDEPSKGDATLRFVMDGDGWPVTGEFRQGGQRMLLERKGTQISMTTFENGKQTDQQIMTLDAKNKTFSGTSNGKEVASIKAETVAGTKDGSTAKIVGKDTKGEVVSQSVLRDGKWFTQITVGDRKILLEGGWNFVLDNGDIIVKPATDPTKK